MRNSGSRDESYYVSRPRLGDLLTGYFEIGAERFARLCRQVTPQPVPRSDHFLALGTVTSAAIFPYAWFA
jgi:hypothetical protein